MIAALTMVVLMVVNSENLVIITNFLVAFSTLLLWAASEHEEHQTLKALAKANQRIVRMLVKALSRRSPNDSD